MSETRDTVSEQIITPNRVESDQPIDYQKLMRDFGSQLIDYKIIDLLEQVIVRRGLEAYRDRYLLFFRRGIFFSHRDFGDLIQKYLTGQSFYIYTGRGPSSQSMHLGHLVPFHMTQILQELFDVPVVIQLTDDEKYLYDTQKTSLTKFEDLAVENSKDIMACGFNPNKTYLFSNLKTMGQLYPMVIQIAKLINLNHIRSVFGFNEAKASSIGQVFFPAVQIAPAFSTSLPHFLGSEILPCLIPCAIDQDAYFRLARDIAPILGFPKPVLLHAQFLTGLLGRNTKMSSSIPKSVIFLSDTAQQIKKKINGAFSGGAPLNKDPNQSQMGANLNTDVAIEYLRFFLSSDQEYQKICDDYQNGLILTNTVKSKVIELLQTLVDEHQKARLES